MGRCYKGQCPRSSWVLVRRMKRLCSQPQDEKHYVSDIVSMSGTPMWMRLRGQSSCERWSGPPQSSPHASRAGTSKGHASARSDCWAGSLGPILRRYLDQAQGQLRTPSNNPKFCRDCTRVLVKWPRPDATKPNGRALSSAFGGGCPASPVVGRSPRVKCEDSGHLRKRGSCLATSGRLLLTRRPGEKCSRVPGKSRALCCGYQDARMSGRRRTASQTC
jgi:hypothetical protein